MATAMVVPVLPHVLSLPSIEELDGNNLAVNGNNERQELRHNEGQGRLRPSPGNETSHGREATDVISTTSSHENNNKPTIYQRKSNCLTLSTALASTPSPSSAPPLLKMGSSCKSKDFSETSSRNSNKPAKKGVRSTHLLCNMMQRHKNRDPYEDYVVLGCLGKGSIGSVEKVVRKHRTHHRQEKKENKSILVNGCPLKQAQQAPSFLGGLFQCCLNDKSEQPGCWYNFMTKKNALQSTPPRPSKVKHITQRHQDVAVRNMIVSPPTPPHQNSDSSNTSPTILSEASAFSAPTSPVPLFDDKTDIMSATQHSFSFYSHPLSHFAHNHHTTQHPLRRYALKSIRLERACNTETGSGMTSSDERELRNEINILRSLDHPQIVRAIETYECRNMIYMVLDLCEGGDLYVMDPYTEKEAACILRQLFGAVAYMHRRGIVHRDLKYENVMFVDRRSGRSKLEIKLIDFGLSMKYGKKKGKWNSKKGRNDTFTMTDFVGTIYTMAPEVILGSYTYKCDLWSLGVMAYMLLSSQIPFCGNDMPDIAKSILRGKYCFTGKRWSQISHKAKDFVSVLLHRNASARPTADQALRNRWLAGRKKVSPSSPKSSLHRRHSSDCLGGTVCAAAFKHSSHNLLVNPPTPPLDSRVCSSIENFSTYSWLHRLALMVIAYRHTEEETAHLREIFTLFDGDDSGTVEVEELRKGFSLHDKYSEEEINQIFLAVDMNGAGKISWTEFLAATIETNGPIPEEEFEEAFERLDLDHSGFISTQNLQDILGKEMPEIVIDQIIDESDKTRDHKIWKDEFLALAQETNLPFVHEKTRRHTHQAILKRCSSADDLDLVERTSICSRSSDYSSDHSFMEDSSGDLGENQFLVEKAKSIRKVSQFR